uniref:B30.2/SPRY domain-containing protein n=1 Tax=Hucho hucho TaxID=62062 RepID=A0A4W5MEX8_9TELE
MQRNGIVTYTPVILDPNTAHSQIVLSDDLTIGTHLEHSMQLPDNPERFDKWPLVLGSLRTLWLGKIKSGWWVFYQSALRKGEIKTRDQSWGLTHLYGTYKAFSPPNDQILLTVDYTRTIRVQLDWDKGTLSFSNPDNATHIHTFTHTFTERVFPHLGNNNKNPLMILPGEVTLVLSPVKCKADPDSDNEGELKKNSSLSVIFRS